MLKGKEIYWYDDIFQLEDSEPLCGLAFIAMQNCINSCIKDRDESLENKHKFYKLGNKLKNFKKTDIELIIGVANYFKHIDDYPNLNKGTLKILKEFKLIKDEKDIDITNSPIFKALELFNNEWDVRKITPIIEAWRIKIWEL